MNNRTDKLDQVQQKIHSVIDLYTMLQARHEALKHDRDQLRNESEDKSRQINLLKEQLEVSRLAAGLNAGSEKALDIQQKINTFATEIDRCIVLLTK